MIQYVGTAPTAVTAGTAETITVGTNDLGSPFQLGRIVAVETAGILRRGWLTPTGGIEHVGDRLTGGYVPLVAFAPDASGSPRFGSIVRPKDNWAFTVDGAANLSVQFALAPAAGPDAKNLRARSLVLQGQTTAPASIAAAGSATIEFDPAEDAGAIGRFIFADAGANDILHALTATDVFLNGKRIWQGSVNLATMAHDALGQPFFGRGLNAANDKISMTVTNNHATLAATPVGCMVVVG